MAVLRVFFIAALALIVASCAFAHSIHDKHPNRFRHTAVGDDYHPINVDATSNVTVVSWHIHVYFVTTSKEQVQIATNLRNAVISTFKPIQCASDCDTWCPDACLWDFNTQPLGPHPMGSWGIYLPTSVFESVSAFVTLNRGGLTVLIHPNTGQPLVDHTTRPFWAGYIVPLNTEALQ